MEWKDISVNPLLISNYNLLQKIGIFDYIEKLKKDNKELVETISEAYDIFKKRSIDDLIEFLTECLSSKFVPSTLVVILKNGESDSDLRVITYQNLKKSVSTINFTSLKDFEPLFVNNESSVHISNLKDLIINSNYNNIFSSLKTEIVIPIKGYSGLYGLIFFGAKILDDSYTKSELDYIDRLIKFISVGIQNNIHYNNSVKDSKTGLYNHTFFIRRVNEEIARAYRSRLYFSLMVIDIDHFKKLNDRFGHLAGDEVIISIANNLKYHLREMDVISRFGGEEFSVLLPETKGAEAEIIAERIRKSIQKMEVKYNDNLLKVTVSIGVSVYSWSLNPDSTNLFNKADEGLYSSKKDGRNRCTLIKSGLLHRAKKYKNL